MQRRDLLKSALGSLAACAGNTTMLGGLGLLNSAQALGSASFNDHKSLVMVFLKGGVDSLALLIPSDSKSYAQYKDLRQHLATPQQNLMELGSDGLAAPDYCAEMLDLFNDKKLSWVSNVGPLRQPTTKTMIQNDERAMPYFVGAHNSQQIMWNSATVDPNAREGWGARMLDLIQSSSSVVTPNISLARNQLFTSTLQTPTFSVNPDGIQNFASLDPPSQGGENPDLDLFYALQRAPRDGLLGRELAARNLRTHESSDFLAQVVGETSESSVAYPSDGNIEGQILQKQLKMAARLIEAAPALDHPRQVIMVEMNAYDTHDNQDRILPALLRSLFSNLQAFQSDLEARGVNQRVVTFSQSDFGRTPTINANGTDHGWGGHNFLMGTPVKGGQIIGEVPEFGIETEKMLYNLCIPDFSVEQYTANLARWFGLSNSLIAEVFPNLHRFDDVDFGLL
jgi:uncharacterized protein (DUF1501 family)